MQVANMFSSAQVSKSCWFTPSSHSQKLEIIPFYSHFPARTPSLFHLFFHFILLHLEIGNCVFGMILKKHGWFLAVCLRISLLPPQKKKKNGRIFSEALVAFPRRKKTHIPPPEKTKRCVPALPFLGGGPFPLAMVDVRQPGFVKPRFFFVGWKAQWVGSSQIHQQVGER